MRPFVPSRRNDVPLTHRIGVSRVKIGVVEAICSDVIGNLVSILKIVGVCDRRRVVG